MNNHKNNFKVCRTNFLGNILKESPTKRQVAKYNMFP